MKQTEQGSALPVRPAAPIEVVAEPIEKSEEAPPGQSKSGRRWLRRIPGMTWLTALWFFLMDDDAPTTKRFVVLLAFVYLISPFDFLPEALLGPLGLMDDLAVLWWLIKFVGSETLRPYRAQAREWMNQ